MKFITVLITVFFLPGMLTLANAAPSQNAFDQVVRPYVSHHAFNGVVLVAKQGKIVMAKGYGSAQMSWNIANTAHTKFALASLSKPFTAHLIMQLVQAGRLKLSDTIDRYLPYLPKENASRITIDSLLGHRSGLPRQFAIEGWSQGKFDRLRDKKAYAIEIGKLTLMAPPGEQYSYTNLGYFLLGLVVEQVTELRFEQALKHYIFDPLGMSQTGTISNEGIIPELAQGYQFAPEGGYRRSSYRNMNLFWAAADLYASAGDLLKFDQALYSDKLLDKKHRRLLLSPESRYSWQLEPWTLPGIDVAKNTINWGGELPGISSFMVRFIDDNNTVIILSNDGLNEIEKRRLARQLASVLYDEDYKPTQLPLSLLLSKALYEGHLIRTIEQIKKDAQHYLVDKSIAQMGLQQMWDGDIHHAVAILALNVDLFPQSAAAYEHLSQALETSGSLQAALKSKQQALKLLSDNRYLQQEVARLKQKLSN